MEGSEKTQLDAGISKDHPNLNPGSKDVIEVNARYTMRQPISRHLSDIEMADIPTIHIDDEPYPEPVIVPRSDRRGFLGHFTILAEIETPIHYSRKAKWFITFIVGLCGLSAPMASSIILPALTAITEDFKTTAFKANLSASFYMLAMAIFPLWWSAFSERFGRRSIYLVSYVLFIVFAILCAISNSIGMYIVMRLLNGGASACVQVVGAGTIADIWEPKERGKAMSWFYFAPLCGPMVAPIIGGALTQGFGWRSTMWFLAIYGGIVLILIVFALPETTQKMKKKAQLDQVETISEINDMASRASTQQAAEMSRNKCLTWLRIIFWDPLSIIGYFRFPVVALIVYYGSITFGSLYMLNISLESTFSKPPYNFSTFVTGFVYFPGSLGFLLGSTFGGAWMDKIMKREAIKAKRYDGEGRLVYRTEDRMRENAWISAVVYPLALLWYGWTSEKGLFWVIPLIPPFFFGMGTMLIFALVTTMLTEFMPKRSSAGVALNNLIRNICSCGGSLTVAPLLKIIGNGWLFTIVGIWCLLSMVVIWIMKRNGARWRESMQQKLK